MPVEQSVRVRFLPFDVPEFAGSDGWLVHEFESNYAAWAWAAGNVSFVEDAYFIKSGHYMLRDGRLQDDG
jgi:hypothetical protein